MRRHPGSKVDNAATRLVVEHRLVDFVIDGFHARIAICSCGWKSGAWSAAVDARRDWEHNHAPEGTFA